MLKLFTLLLMTSIFFVACNPDELSELPTTPEVTTPSIVVNQLSNLTMDNDDEPGQGDPENLVGCYEVVPPLTFVYEDGSTVEVSSEEDFEAVFTTEPFPVDVAFPINLEDIETGEVVSAANEDELTAYFEDCEWEGGSEYCDDLEIIGELPCYDIDFPVTFLLADGTSVTAETEDDLEGIFTGGADVVDFVYPVNLTNVETGEAVTAADAGELETIFLECIIDETGEIPGDDGSIYCDSLFILGDLPCYDFNYPLSFELGDGSTITVDSEDDLQDIFIEGADVVDFVYPLSLTNVETGEVVSAEDEEALGELFLECFEGWNPGGGIEFEFENPCFSLVYPINLSSNGEEIEVNSAEEFGEALFNSQGEIEIVYPYDVTLTETGEVVTIESEEDMFEVFEDCEG